MNKKMFLYLFGLCVFFFAVGYLFLSNSAIFKDKTKSVKIVESVPTIVPQTSPAPQKEVNPKGWLIHTNNREGYSFKYPSDWTINPLPEDGDYKLGTTTIKTPNNGDQNFDLGEVKMDISYHPYVEVKDEKLSPNGKEDFAIFTQDYLNKPNSDDGFDTIVICGSYNIWTGGESNAATCQIKETKSAFPKPYQMMYFKKEKKFYSVIIYGEPTDAQKDDIKIFIDNFQLID